MHRSSLSWIGLVSLGLVACGGGEAGPASGGSGGSAGAPGPTEQGCDGVHLAPPAPGEGIQVSIDLEVEAGDERQVCKLVLAGQDVNLNYSEGLFTSGSHHALVFRTNYHDVLPTQNTHGETVDASVATDCHVNPDWDVTAVVAGGRAVDGNADTVFPKGTLPDDVALKVAGNEVLAVNFHLLNATSEKVHACYKANLNSIPDAQVKAEAGTIFYYNSFITVPPNGTATAAMACPVAHDVTLAGQVSHMHRRGTSYTASLLDGDPLAGGTEVQKLYEGTDWEEPPVRLDQPGLALKQGQWLRWSCGYTNSEPRAVAQGQETTDEMCMFIGSYWPRSNEMDWCADGPLGSAYSASRPLGTGTLTGAQLAACWTKSPKAVLGGGPASSADRYASQRCLTESCANASGRLNDWGAGRVDMNTVTCN